MHRILGVLNRIESDEQGHAMPAGAALIAGAGIVLLGIGAANDSGALAIIGGIVGGVGVLAASLLDHMKIDYDMYDRLEKLEKK